MGRAAVSFARASLQSSRPLISVSRRARHSSLLVSSYVNPVIPSYRFLKIHFNIIPPKHR